jgi:hypothetical protein
MAPDVWHAVRAGARLVVVYLTSGGQCALSGRSVAGAQRADSAGIGREAVLAAYADLAAGDVAGQWTFAEAPSELAALGRAQRADLGRIRIVFADLPEALPGTSFAGLWTAQSEATRQTVAALERLLADERPDVVRIMDLDPEHLEWVDGESVYSDDAEHTSAARLAYAAFEQYAARFADGRVILESYRGQTNRQWPAGLSQADRALKARTVTPPAGIALPEPLLADLGSTTLRFPATTNWLCRDGLGRLTAAAGLGGRVVVWRQRRPGEDGWVEVDGVPRPDAGSTVAPPVSAIAAVDGRVHLFAQRIKLAGTADDSLRDAVTSFQSTPGGAFRDWEALGSPYDTVNDNPVRREPVGPPTAVALADGGVQFFIRNFGTGLSSRRRTFGHGWSPWLDFGSTSREGAVALSLPDGRVAVFASAEKGLVSWTQYGPSGRFEFEGVREGAIAAGPLSVVGLTDGALAVLTRKPETAEVLASVRAADGTWNGPFEALGAPGGYGAVAACYSARRRSLALATRDGDGGLSLAWWDPSTQRGPLDWRPARGPLTVGAPALAADADHRIVAATLGADGGLYVATLDPDRAAEPATFERGLGQRSAQSFSKDEGTGK